MKVVADVAVPPGAVTESTPVVARLGTVAVICVALLTVKIAAVPLNFTAVAPVRFVPVNITDVPARPEAGKKLSMVGGGPFTVSVTWLEVALPALLVTTTTKVAPLSPATVGGVV